MAAVPAAGSPKRRVFRVPLDLAPPAKLGAAFSVCRHRSRHYQSRKRLGRVAPEDDLDNPRAVESARPAVWIMRVVRSSSSGGQRTAGLPNYRTLGGPAVSSPALLGDKALMYFGEIAAALRVTGSKWCALKKGLIFKSFVSRQFSRYAKASVCQAPNANLTA
jgi:hypothetical protein